MRIRSWRLVAPITAALLALPAVTAGPIFAAGLGTIEYTWSVGPQAGACFDTLAMSFQEAQFRLIVTAKSGVRHLGWSGAPRAECALDITLAPGVHVNPCDVLAGRPPSPAQGVDPFFVRGPTHHSKAIAFLDGGRVNYHVDTDDARLWGDCVSGSSRATWWGLVHAREI